MIKVLLGLCLFFLCCGCSESFTAEEKHIINGSEGIMRIWKIDNRKDSLFLRQTSKPLGKGETKTVDFLKLKERMLATVNDPSDPGVGIAAPQVGIGRQLVAVQRYDKPGTPFEFYVNPKIEYYSKAQALGMEGCLSVPAIADSVWRSTEIVISYIPDGEEVEYERRQDTVKGFTAVIFQHEIDHLNGILFIDRIAGNMPMVAKK